MKISTNWLRRYVSFHGDIDTLAQSLTNVGLEIEEIEAKGSSFSGVVSGDILSVEKHPKADKLSVCKVDVGGSILTIVCGAPNVASGLRVPVARIGAKLPGGLAITQATLRGVESYGMICSSKELGLDGNADGILVLDPGRYPGPGMTVEGENPGDSVLTVNVTPNRPDCLSHIGIAREIGAVQEVPLRMPEASPAEDGESVQDAVAIEILDPKACPRYAARVIRDVHIGPSPEWLSRLLESVGIRSINNIVDITNFVLMETGHPLHAFDFGRIAGNRIVIRKAENGERFRTLDGLERILDAEDLLICDHEKPVALAGIMGGLNSEISEGTAQVLLESAYFDPMTIRKTAKRLGMSTEASQRFERGCDPEMAVFALNRAAALMAEIAGGRVLKGIRDSYPGKRPQVQLSMRLSRIERVLGQAVPREDVVSILHRLGLTVEGAETLRVTAPTFRPDLKAEIDLIEEVARHYGYDRIEPRMKSHIRFQDARNPLVTFMESVRQAMIGMGFTETLNTGLVSAQKTGVYGNSRNPITVQNPLSPDSGFLRNTLITDLLDNISWNNNRMAVNLRLFQIGKIFFRNPEGIGVEPVSLACAISGQREEKAFWGRPNTGVNYYQLRGVLDALSQSLQLPPCQLVPSEDPALSKGHCFEIRMNQTPTGFLGRLGQDLMKNWDIRNETFVFEVFLEEMMRFRPASVKTKPLSRFPSVLRDLAWLVDETIQSGQIENLIRQNGGPHLVSVDLFDLYQGKQVPQGKKSMAYSLCFTSQERTLTDADVDPVIARLIQEMQETFSASLRQ
jgi:phenylalanyl-tRNA synthetase beta chain